MTPPLRPELRRLLLPVYVPWGLTMLGAGMLLPVLPVWLEDSGLRLSMVGLVLAAAGIGSALGGLPASAVAERRGADGLLLASVLLCAVATLLLGVSDAVIVLVVLRAAYGFGFSGITQSRQVVIARSVDGGLRGRVNSFVGGLHRLAYVVGPLLGGVLFDRFGADTVFVVAGIVTGVGVLVLARPLARDPHPVAPEEDRIRVLSSLWRYRRRLIVASLGPLMVSSARAGRHVVVPLIGDSLDLGPAGVGALVAVGMAADFLLFPVSGWLMDRWGRLHSMVPAFSLMAAGLAVLAAAHSVVVAIAGGVIMGVGNGLSAGTMLTLSTDLAPTDEPGPFLAGFNTVSGAGTFLGPFAAGWAADALGLGASALVLATMLLAGVVWIVAVIGETGARGDVVQRSRTSAR